MTFSGSWTLCLTAISSGGGYSSLSEILALPSSIQFLMSHQRKWPWGSDVLRWGITWVKQCPSRSALFACQRGHFHRDMARFLLQPRQNCFAFTHWAKNYTGFVGYSLFLKTPCWKLLIGMEQIIHFSIFTNIRTAMFDLQLWILPSPVF